MQKRTIPQAVFETKEAKRIIRAGMNLAIDELENTPRHLLNEGNPNHPMYDNKIFGYNEKEFLKGQYK